ncbi:MAG: YfcE family phosphodiesterase [Ruminococcus sp.]|nr:YfcE family phosphodiesterase [Ruminococcus sp.]
MDVLLISDSHGSVNNIRTAIEKENDCAMLFFLGDGLSDIEKVKSDYPNKTFLCVPGNNDFGYTEDTVAYKYIEGNTIVYTHGHRFNVRYSLGDLLAHADSVMANVVFYGHTHRADLRYDSYKGVYLINPGAMCEGKYAVVTLNKYGAETEFKSIYE